MNQRRPLETRWRMNAAESETGRDLMIRRRRGCCLPRWWSTRGEACSTVSLGEGRRFTRGQSQLGPVSTCDEYRWSAIASSVHSVPSVAAIVNYHAAFFYPWVSLADSYRFFIIHDDKTPRRAFDDEFVSFESSGFDLSEEIIDRVFFLFRGLLLGFEQLKSRIFMDR